MTQGTGARLLCLSGNSHARRTYVCLASVLVYVRTALALLRLRRTQPDLPRPVKAFGYPILPALYMVAVLFLLVVLLIDPVQRKYSAFGLLIVALGIPVYFAWKKTTR